MEGRAEFVALGDLNGDGRRDILTANRETDTISVLLAQADGSFGARTVYATR